MKRAKGKANGRGKVAKPPRVTPRQPKLKARRQRILREETINVGKPEDLGPRLLPKPAEAVEVLADAADINDAALKAHQVYLELADKTAKAKKAWRDKETELQRHIRLHTHESALPLLNEIEQREADQAAMEAAIEDPDPSVA